MTMPNRILVPRGAAAAHSIPDAPYGEDDLLLAPWSAWQAPPPTVDSESIGFRAPQNLGEIPEVLAATWKKFWIDPNGAHPAASLPFSFGQEELLPENARELWDRFALLAEGWSSATASSGTQSHPTLFAGRPCRVAYAQQVLWDAMMEKLLADSVVLNIMGPERFEALLSHLDVALHLDRSRSTRMSDAAWFSSVSVLKDQMGPEWRPCLDRLARHFAASDTTSLMYDGCFVQWWKEAVRAPAGLESWSVLDPEIDQKAVFRQWRNVHVAWSHGSFLATQAPLDQLGGWIDALRAWDLHVAPTNRVGRSLAVSALGRLLLEQPSQQKQITPDRFRRLRAVAARLASWPKTDLDPPVRFETTSLARLVCSIFSDPLPPQAQSDYENAVPDLVDILLQDVDWSNEEAEPSPRFPMGGASVSLLVEHVGLLVDRLMRGAPDTGSTSAKILRAIIALPLLDGHRHELVSTVFHSSRWIHSRPEHVAFRDDLLDAILNAATRSECLQMLTDSRLAAARPNHPAVEREILSRTAGIASSESEVPSPRRRLV